MRIEVRNNNVEKAMRILKKKLTEDGFFNELREREYYQSKGTKRRRAKAAAKRRTERDLKKVFPRESWNKLHLQIIYFGREYCPARGHVLADCPICSWAATKKRMREEQSGSSRG